MRSCLGAGEPGFRPVVERIFLDMCRPFWYMLSQCVCQISSLLELAVELSVKGPFVA